VLLWSAIDIKLDVELVLFYISVVLGSDRGYGWGLSVFLLAGLCVLYVFSVRG
jgi:hypothetical protein